MRSTEENTEYFRERRKKKKNINIEVDKEISDLLDEYIKNIGITKKQWFDDVVKTTIYNNGYLKARLLSCQSFPDIFECIYNEIKKGTPKTDILSVLKEIDIKINKKDMELLKNYLKE